MNTRPWGARLHPAPAWFDTGRRVNTQPMTRDCVPWKREQRQEISYSLPPQVILSCPFVLRSVLYRDKKKKRYAKYAMCFRKKIFDLQLDRITPICNQYLTLIRSILKTKKALRSVDRDEGRNGTKLRSSVFSPTGNVRRYRDEWEPCFWTAY